MWPVAHLFRKDALSFSLEDIKRPGAVQRQMNSEQLL